MIYKVYKSETNKICLGYITLCSSNICKESVCSALQKIKLIVLGWDLKGTSISMLSNGSFFLLQRPKAPINPANGLPRYVSPEKKFWIAQIDWDAPKTKAKSPITNLISTTIYPDISFASSGQSTYHYNRR